MRSLPTILFSAVLFLLLAVEVSGATITFDLTKLPPGPVPNLTLVQEGIELRLAVQRDAFQLVATAQGIGVDSGYPGEVAGFTNGSVPHDCVDGQCSSYEAESMVMLVSGDAWLQSIRVVWNGSPAAGEWVVKGVAAALPFGDGVTEFQGAILEATSAQYIRHSNAYSSPASGGFAIQTITIRTIPEPGVAGLGLLAIAGFAVRRRRAR